MVVFNLFMLVKNEKIINKINNYIYILYACIFLNEFVTVHKKMALEQFDIKSLPPYCTIGFLIPSHLSEEKERIIQSFLYENRDKYATVVVICPEAKHNLFYSKLNANLVVFHTLNETSISAMESFKERHEFLGRESSKLLFILDGCSKVEKKYRLDSRFCNLFKFSRSLGISVWMVETHLVEFPAQVRSKLDMLLFATPPQMKEKQKLYEFTGFYEDGKEFSKRCEEYSFLIFLNTRVRKLFYFQENHNMVENDMTFNHGNTLVDIIPDKHNVSFQGFNVKPILSFETRHKIPASNVEQHLLHLHDLLSNGNMKDYWKLVNTCDAVSKSVFKMKLSEHCLEKYLPSSVCGIILSYDVDYIRSENIIIHRALNEKSSK